MKTTLFEPQLLCAHIWFSMASQTFFFFFDNNESVIAIALHKGRGFSNILFLKLNC